MRYLFKNLFEDALIIIFLSVIAEIVQIILLILYYPQSSLFKFNHPISPLIGPLGKKISPYPLVFLKKNFKSNRCFSLPLLDIFSYYQYIYQLLFIIIITLFLSV